MIPPLPTASTVGTVTNPAVSMPAGSFAETDNIFLNYMYGYHYDSRNRLTDKKVPGQGWQYTVYNRLDQPILTQDAGQAGRGIWMVNKYDAQGRIAMTGEYAMVSGLSSKLLSTEPDAQTMPAAAPPAGGVSPGLVQKISIATGLTGGLLWLYIIVSEGSRLYPPRNLIPVL